MVEKEFSPRWEEVNCHLCGGQGRIAPILLHGKPLVQGQFGYEIHPVICECGLVFLNPRWTKETYAKFYEYYYDSLYRLELKPDYGIAGVKRNMAEIWERIRGDVGDGVRNVLDIGCGSGHGLSYLREQMPNIAIFGVEASPYCQRILTEEVGAVLLGEDLEGQWLSENRGKFDLIIMRHVVEHLLNPVEELKKIRMLLAPGGAIYIAVPDMMHPRTVLRDYEYWWEYYFRAVHPYYYCRETLFKTLKMAGLYPKKWDEVNEEVWCLVNTEEVAMVFEGDLYARQMAILRHYLP